MADRKRRSQSFARGVRGGVRDAAGLGLVAAMDELGRERSVVFEVGCCRLAARRLAAIDLLEGDVVKVTRALRRVSASLVRASRLQALIAAEGGATASDALTALLLEMGAE